MGKSPGHKGGPRPAILTRVASKRKEGVLAAPLPGRAGGSRKAKLSVLTHGNAKKKKKKNKGWGKTITGQEMECT